MIHPVSVKKYHKYPSILILKHTNVLAGLIKSKDMYLYQISTYKKCTVLKSTHAQMIILETSCEQKV